MEGFMKDLWGMETSIDLKDCDPKSIRSEMKIRIFVQKLCELIKVKTYGDCIVVDFGKNERISGYSMVQLIESSLISAHFVNKTNSIYMNIFSCKEYDVKKATVFVKRYFRAKNMEFIINFRQV